MNKTLELLSNMPKDSFYVYAYLRSEDSDCSKKHTPYYIGKGVGKRAIRWHQGVGVPKDKTKIVILESNLTEIGALALERRMISWWGRKDLGNGVLINKTDGGDGISGAVLSPETRAKMSTAKQGKPLPPRSDEHKKNLSVALSGRIGTPITEEWRKNLSRAKTGFRKTAEHRDKIRQTLTGVKSNRYSCMICKTELGVNNLGKHFNSHFGLNKKHTLSFCSCVVCQKEVTINNLGQHFNNKHGTTA